MKTNIDKTSDHKTTDHAAKPNRTTRPRAVGRPRKSLEGKDWMQRAVAKVAEHWWRDASPLTKAAVMCVAGMIDELTGSKRIEIRKEGSEIRARFIYILRQPEPGCVSAIMLPEAAREGCWRQG